MEASEGGWRCRNHPSAPSSGVCPTCLRERLELLCPDCAKTRPCACEPSPTVSELKSPHSPSFSSPFSSSSSAQEAAVTPPPTESAAQAEQGEPPEPSCRNVGRGRWGVRWRVLCGRFSFPWKIFRRKKTAKVS